jgi:hypothetical protein
MGTLSVNRYAGIEITPETIVVKYLLDFAEVPALRELERVDPDEDDRVTPDEREVYLAARSAEVLPRLVLEVNGRRLALESTWSRVVFPPGETGLSTVRLAWELHAVLPEPPRESNFLRWSDGNLEGVPGWKEVRFAASGGLGIGRTSLRDVPSSDGLEAYPEEFLRNPPADTKAWCQFGPGMAAAPAGGDPRPSWLPGWLPGRASAVTAIILATLLGGIALATLRNRPRG